MREIRLSGSGEGAVLSRPYLIIMKPPLALDLWPAGTVSRVAATCRSRGRRARHPRTGVLPRNCIVRSGSRLPGQRHAGTIAKRPCRITRSLSALH